MCAPVQLALQAGEEAGDPPPAVKGTKKKKKKAAGKKKMSKEDAIAAAQEAQAAAAAALLKGISHEDAAKAAQAALAVRPHPDHRFSLLSTCLSSSSLLYFSANPLVSFLVAGLVSKAPV